MAGMNGCFKCKKSSQPANSTSLGSTSSDRAAMASGPSDVLASQEPAEVKEECSGKKKSKFQTFKKFFARKKKKEPSGSVADAGLKASQSSDNVSKASENNALTRLEKDKGSGSKINLGSKALSHDSVFVSDSSEANEALGASQDSIHGKVKSLQLQLKQAIKVGSPPSLICVKGREDAGTMSEDDGLPCSPPEYTNLHTVMTQAQRNSSISLDHNDDQLSCAASSRAMSPLVVPGDFSQPASPFGCLDNSAAKHKMGLRHKACNKRKPASRLEMKPEGDSVDEVLNTSIAEALVEHEQLKTEDVSFDELKFKVEREEEEEEEGEEEEEEEEEVERGPPKHSTLSLSEDKEKREEESEAEQDVSHRPDTVASPQPSLSEKDVSDARPLPSSKPCSTASSVDSIRATPEPPAGPREYLFDPSGVACGAEENTDESDLAFRGEEEEEDDREPGEEVGEEEGESSLLQEVLSSLKTPLASCSLSMEAEGATLKVEQEVKGVDKEEFEIEEGEEMKEEELKGTDSYQSVPSVLELLVCSTEEEEDTATVSCQEDVDPEDKLEEEEEAEEEEEVVVDQFGQHGLEDEVEEVKSEQENDEFVRQTHIQVEEEADEDYQSEGEEEAIELEKEPEVEEEGREKTEEPVEEQAGGQEGKERVEEAEEAIEEERDDAEEMTERFPDADDAAPFAAPLQKPDLGVDVVVGDDSVSTTKLTDHEEIPAEVGEEGFNDCQANFDQAPEDESDSGEEKEEEEAGEIEHTKPKSDPEEDVEANQEVADQDSDISHLDVTEKEIDQTEAEEQAFVSSKPPSLFLPESNIDSDSQESKPITPSKTSTTTIHINLVSPSSEKAATFFQHSPTSAQPKESESPSSNAAAEQATAFTEEDKVVDTVEEIEEEEPSDVEEETPSTESAKETVNQLSNTSDQSKVRFTIAPAWQRTQGLTSPSSPPACPSSPTATEPEAEGVEAAGMKDPADQVEPEGAAKVELVLSPGTVMNEAKPLSNTAASHYSVQPQASANTDAIKRKLSSTTDEDFHPPPSGSSVIAEGNPNNPFGVRLRKTSALHRFSSEEENAETPTEEPPQPVSVKVLTSQPVSNKPAIPKKPDVHRDNGGKIKSFSEPAAGCGVPGGLDSPSWISVAKQKQKIYKDNSLEEISLKKEEPERKSSLPTYVTSAANREQSNKTAESASTVSLLEICKPSSPTEKEARRALSAPTPVPLQSSKSPLVPSPVAPKPQFLPASVKPTPQPNSAPRSLSPPTPVPVYQKSPSCTSPPSLSKAAPSLPLFKTAQPQSPTVTSPPATSRTTLESTASRAPGHSPSAQRGLPAPALSQDEPPWMALAKKKAKAWSEMPQIVQ